MTGTWLRRRDERDRGFTLIELLVVILIIGVLTAIAVPVFINQRKKANDASARTAVRNLALVQEAWIADHPGAPGSDDPTELVDAGYRKTRGMTVYTSINPSTGGYCLLARSSYGLDSGGGYPQYVIWDSTGGGMLNGGRFMDHSSTATPGFHSCGPGRTTFNHFP